MNIAAARSFYTRTGQVEANALNTPHELIQVTLSTLRHSTEMTLRPEIDPSLFARHKAKALSAIYILQSSLDLEAGGDLARNLFQLYEYGRLQLLEFRRNADGEKVKVFLHAIDEIIDAWEAIK